MPETTAKTRELNPVQKLVAATGLVDYHQVPGMRLTGQYHTKLHQFDYEALIENERYLIAALEELAHGVAHRKSGFDSEGKMESAARLRLASALNLFRLVPESDEAGKKAAKGEDKWDTLASQQEAAKQYQEVARQSTARLARAMAEAYPHTVRSAFPGGNGQPKAGHVTTARS